MLNIKNFNYAVDKANNLISWQVYGQLTVDEATRISDQIKKEIAQFPKGAAKLLVDNRAMEQEGKQVTFSAEVNKVWTDLQMYLIPFCSHVAVICGSMMMQAQMNRIAKESGLSEVLKAFWAPNNSPKSLEDALKFIGVKENSLVK